MDANSPLKNHPIAVEMIRLVDGKIFQCQGIVKLINNPNNPKVTMTGKSLYFNQKSCEMNVRLKCSLAAENRCTFEGKINIKDADVFQVVRQIQITKRFESVKNVTRNAVRYMQRQ